MALIPMQKDTGCRTPQSTIWNVTISTRPEVFAEYGSTIASNEFHEAINSSFQFPNMSPCSAPPVVAPLFQTFVTSFDAMARYPATTPLSNVPCQIISAP